MVKKYIQYSVSSPGFHPDGLHRFMEGEFLTLTTLDFSPEAFLWNLKIEKRVKKASFKTISSINKSRLTFFKTVCGLFWLKNVKNFVHVFGLHGVL